MLKILRLTLVGLLCATALTEGIGQTGIGKNKPGYTRGAGMKACGEYLADRTADRYSQVYTHWVMGYVSAYNHFTSGAQVAEIPPATTIEAYLDKYCRDNPLKTVFYGTTALIKDLIK